MLVRVLIVSTIIGLVTLVAMLLLTNPGTLGPLGILIVFIAGYTSLLGIMTCFLYFSQRLYRVVARVVWPRNTIGRMSLQRAYFYSTILALLPMMLISLYSVGRVTPYEIGLLAVFGLMGVIYIAKRT